MSLIGRLKSLVAIMKRKRNSDSMQTYDVVLTDASGRSVRAHRALLMDKSDYFARILEDHNLKELQLNENHLIELIHYLYAHDSDYRQPGDNPRRALSPQSALHQSDTQRTDDARSPQAAPPQSEAMMESASILDKPSTPPSFAPSTAVTNSDIEVLMRLLQLSKKYGFRQLYRNLMNEINYKLSPHTAIVVYKCARQLDMEEFLNQTRMMILSWLPQLKLSEEFLSLDEESIRDIYTAESPAVESESKLDALSVWWTRNKEANMTDLWVNFMMSG